MKMRPPDLYAPCQVTNNGELLARLLNYIPVHSHAHTHTHLQEIELLFEHVARRLVQILAY